MSRQRALSEPSAMIALASDSFDDGPDPTSGAVDGRRGVLVRMSPAARKALRQLALDDDSSVQALMIEAVNALFLKRGRLPIA